MTNTAASIALEDNNEERNGIFQRGRGRLRRRDRNLLRETANTEEKSERTVDLIATVESDENEGNDITNETVNIEEESVRSGELIGSLAFIEHERQDITNKEEHVFRTPENDYSILGLHDEEPNELPSYPVLSSLVSSERIHGGCCTCLNTIATHIFVPCGHLCICSNCEQQLEDQKCPLCRAEYIQCVRAIRT